MCPNKFKRSFSSAGGGGVVLGVYTLKNTVAFHYIFDGEVFKLTNTVASQLLDYAWNEAEKRCL